MYVGGVFLLFFSFLFEDAHGPSAVIQENVSQREEPAEDLFCCGTCKRPYEQSANEEHTAKRAKHDEVHLAPTVSGDKFSYMGKVCHSSCNSFELSVFFYNQQCNY